MPATCLAPVFPWTFHGDGTLVGNYAITVAVARNSAKADTVLFDITSDCHP